MTEGDHLLLQELTAHLNGWLSVVAGRNDESSCFRTAHHSNKMFRDLRNANRLLVPLHFDEVVGAFQFDDAVDLLNDAFARVADEMKSFTYQNAVRREQ